jgi:hypothetical protein
MAKDDKAKSRAKEADDWRRETLDRVRALIREADPDATEERKWKKPSNGMKGIPVWSHHGILCTGETYKDKVKLTFACGAALKDPARLFNASLDGGTRRAIDIPEGAKIDDKAFRALIRGAAEMNAKTHAARQAGKGKTAKRAKRQARRGTGA